MKKRIVSFMLAFLMCGSLFSSCQTEVPPEETTEYTDGSSAVETEIPPETSKGLIIVSGEKKPLFSVVRSDTADQETIDAVVSLSKKFREAGVKSLNVTTDFERFPEEEQEIIVGSTLRKFDSDVYIPDVAFFGKNDYMIKAIGTKILIWGRPEALKSACAAFFSMWETEGEFTVPADLTYIYKDGKSIGTLMAEECDISEYTIITDPKSNVISDAAATLQKGFFDACGAIVPIRESAEEKTISFRLDPNAESFTVTLSEGRIDIVGSDLIGLSRGVRDLLEDELSAKTDEKVLTEGMVYKKDYGQFVTYEQFGAVGDGKTDDQNAIVAAHEYANKNHLPVLAREGAEYYIGGAKKIAVIQTDTDWSNARFIIDDSETESYSTEVFRIASANTEKITLPELKTLKAGATNIGCTLPCDAMVILKNSTVRQFIRKGANENSGNPMQDVILVDKNGNIDPSTPVLWDFDTITSITVKPHEEKALTLRGGIITTLANSIPDLGYYYRGIRVYRSNTVIDGLTHYVENEGATGSPYYGIIIVHSVYDFTMKNCVLSGHKIYKKSENGVNRGTYDVTFDTSTHIKIENCSQVNDITDSSLWGVFASNCCKNIELENCSFSRFDAHRGVCNVTIRNSEIGHQGINLIGQGTALIENTTVKNATQFINLRNDYGSTFDGDIIIRDCTFAPKSSKEILLINGKNTGDWDFGYTCYLPRTVTIEGFKLINGNVKQVYVFADITPEWKSDAFNENFKPILTEKVVIKGLTYDTEPRINISKNTFMFNKTEFVYE